ncbi:MAG: hypothetical protein KGO96_07385 [Elusimicrobia bacterium]|nr:hypothetical protein [Elusimicrobiota bacterium]
MSNINLNLNQIINSVLAQQDSTLNAAGSLTLEGDCAATSGKAIILNNQNAQTSGSILSVQSGGTEKVNVDFGGNMNWSATAPVLKGNAAATSGVALAIDNATAQTSGKILSCKTGGSEVAYIDFAGEVSASKVLLPTGVAGTAGQATLASGTVTVSTTAVTASSIIIVTYSGSPINPGTLNIGTITAGTSFVIHSSSGTDASVVNWMLVN